MNTIQQLLTEMEREALTTRKFLSIVPEDKFDWQPHPKSMNLERLTRHLAELPMWVTMTLTSEELDFENNPYDPKPVTSRKELLAMFEESLASGKEHLQKTNEEELQKMWTLRSGKTIYSVEPKYEVLRMTFCQIVHHRAQLGVFLRLLNVPIPGSYGPSADEMSL